jgi:ribosome-associated heat shock protein Hsp15
LAALRLFEGEKVRICTIAFARDRESLRFAVTLFSPTDIEPATESRARIDKWLWAVRLFKTRALATDACKAGSVCIGDHAIKPARDAHIGEIVTVRQGLITRTLEVVGVPRSRVGAKLVPLYCKDLTPPEEFERLREQRIQHVLAREKGSGRPTKRDRRQIDRFLS